MKNTLIVPDLHLAWRVGQKIIDSVGADEVIFLGDFFDDFEDDPNQINEMVDWLQAIITKPNFTFLYGNHDCHYAFPQEWFRCSGYEQWKHFIIRDRLDKDKFWSKFKFYHVLDNKWLLSHAGLHKMWLHKNIAALRKSRPKFLTKITEYLDSEIEKGMRNQSWIFHAGFARWGTQRVGGLTWCDFTREFNPIRGLNQIMGHTPQEYGAARWCYLNDLGVQYANVGDYTPDPADYDNPEKSLNICLDVWKNTHWAVWDGKKMTFGKYSDL